MYARPTDSRYAVTLDTLYTVLLNDAGTHQCIMHFALFTYSSMAMECGLHCPMTCTCSICGFAESAYTLLPFALCSLVPQCLLKQLLCMPFTKHQKTRAMRADTYLHSSGLYSFKQSLQDCSIGIESLASLQPELQPPSSHMLFIAKETAEHV